MILFCFAVRCLLALIDNTHKTIGVLHGWNTYDYIPIYIASIAEEDGSAAAWNFTPGEELLQFGTSCKLLIYIIYHTVT